MKKIIHLSTAIAMTAGALVSTPVMADATANVGFVSDYYFRGQNLGDGGVYAGVDYEVGGFYVGTWWIDDGSEGNDGLETDFYLGYNMDLGDGLSLGVGYTRYEYTYSGDFEHEIALSAEFQGFGFEFVDGEDEDEGASAVDYNFYSFSWSGDVFGVTLGAYDNDNDSEYKYLEFSASGEVAGVDVTVSVGKTTDVELGGVSSSSGDGYMVLDISKTFDL